MSLEERIDDLIQAIEELTAAIIVEGVTDIKVSSFDVATIDDIPGVVTYRGNEQEAVDFVATAFEAAEVETPVAVNKVEEHEPETEIVPANQRTIELIALSKELGFEYLLEGDQLAVDNRVLDEYNRRELGDGV